MEPSQPPQSPPRPPQSPPRPPQSPPRPPQSPPQPPQSPQPEENTSSSNENSLTSSINELILDTLDEAALTPYIDYLDSFDEDGTESTARELSNGCDEAAAMPTNQEQHPSGCSEASTKSASQYFECPEDDDASTSEMDKQHGNYNEESSQWSNSLEQLYESSFEDAASTSTSWEQQNSFDESVLTSSVYQEYRQSNNKSASPLSSPEKHNSSFDEASSTSSSPQKQYANKHNSTLSWQQQHTHYGDGASLTMSLEQLYIKTLVAGFASIAEPQSSNSIVDQAATASLSAEQQYTNIGDQAELSNSFNDFASSLEHQQNTSSHDTSPSTSSQQKQYINNRTDATSASLSLEEQEYIESFDEAVLESSPNQQQQQQQSFGTGPSIPSPHKQYTYGCGKATSTPTSQRDLHLKNHQAANLQTSLEQQTTNCIDGATLSPMSREQQHYEDSLYEAIFPSSSGTQSSGGTVSTSTSEQHRTFSLRESSSRSSPQKQHEKNSFKRRPQSLEKQSTFRDRGYLSLLMGMEDQQYIKDFGDAFTLSPGQQHTQSHGAAPSTSSSANRYINSYDEATSLRPQHMANVKVATTQGPQQPNAYCVDDALSRSMSQEQQEYVNDFDAGVFSPCPGQVRQGPNAFPLTLSPGSQYASNSVSASLPTRGDQSNIDPFDSLPSTSSLAQQYSYYGSEAPITSMSQNQKKLSTCDETATSSNVAQQFTNYVTDAPSPSISQDPQYIKKLNESATTSSIAQQFTNYVAKAPTTSMRWNQKCMNTHDKTATSSSISQQFTNCVLGAPITSMGQDQQIMNTFNEPSTSSLTQQFTNYGVAVPTTSIDGKQQLTAIIDGTVKTLEKYTPHSVGQEFVKKCEEATSRSESQRRQGTEAMSSSLGQRFVRSCERLYVCVQCGRECSSYYSFKVHVKTHSGEKNFVCKLCKKAYTTKHHLTLHMRKHTGERPYSCEICGKTFADDTNRNRHRKIHFKFKKA